MGRSLLITSRKRMSEVSGGGTAFSTAVVLSSLAKPPDGSSAVRRHCSLDVLVYHISLSIPPIRRLLHYGKQALSPRSGHEPLISQIYRWTWTNSHHWLTRYSAICIRVAVFVYQLS